MVLRFVLLAPEVAVVVVVVFVVVPVVALVGVDVELLSVRRVDAGFIGDAAVALTVFSEDLDGSEAEEAASPVLGDWRALVVERLLALLRALRLMTGAAAAVVVRVRVEATGPVRMGVFATRLRLLDIMEDPARSLCDMGDPATNGGARRAKPGRGSFGIGDSPR